MASQGKEKGLRKKSRKRMIAFLNKLRLFVDQEDLPVQDLGLNFLGMVLTTGYFFMSGYLLLKNPNVTLSSYLLNLLGLLYSFVNTLLKNKEYNKIVAGEVKPSRKTTKENQKELDAFLSSNGGYQVQTRAKIAVLIIGITVGAVSFLANPLTGYTWKVFFALMPLVSWMDNIITHLENLYRAHPPFPRAVDSTSKKIGEKDE